MAWLATKYLITAAVVIVVSEAAKRSDKLGGFVAALPLVTFLALIWLYMDKQLKPVNLRLGVTDGSYTELLSGELQENIVGECREKMISNKSRTHFSTRSMTELHTIRCVQRCGT